MTTAAPTREQWLEERRSGLGATDLSAVLGLNPYQTPLGVYCTKVGIDPPQAETSAMRRGLRLEPFIAQMYADKTGSGVRKYPGTLKHPDKSHLFVSPDYYVDLADIPDKSADSASSGPAHLVEVKSHLPWLAHYYGEPGSDQIPEWEQVQCQWQCHLTGISRCDLVVLLGLSEDDLRIFETTYDPEIGGILEQEADRFWQDHIVRQVPPPVTGREADSELLKRLYPYERDTVILANEATNVAACGLRKARAQRQMAEEIEAQFENTIKEFMGEAAILETAEGKFTWKAPKSGAVSWKAIAEELGPAPQSLIDKHTGEPSRRFLTPFKKGQS